MNNEDTLVSVMAIGALSVERARMIRVAMLTEYRHHANADRWFTARDVALAYNALFPSHAFGAETMNDIDLLCDLHAIPEGEPIEN